MSIRPNRYLIKFSDDRVLLSLLSIDEVGHGPVLNDFVAWCDRSYLCLNATKTNDMCIDFRKYPPSQSDTVIHDNKIEVVDEYKYRGKTIDNKLKFCFICWFGNVSQKDKNKLQRVVNISSKITGFKQSSVTALYETQVLRKANKLGSQL